MCVYIYIYIYIYIYTYTYSDTTAFPKILLLVSWLPNLNLTLKTLDWERMWETSTYFI